MIFLQHRNIESLDKTLRSLCLCGLTVLFFSCKKEQPALSKTDCGCAKEVSADFKIEEIYDYGYDWEKRTETDTSFSNKNIAFIASDSLAEYTWLLGSEVLDTREIVRYFSDVYDHQAISIKLIIKKKPNTICYPNDDGIDTVTKKLFLYPYSFDSTFKNSFPIMEGVYRMKEKNGHDSIDITFLLDDLGINFGGSAVKIHNYDKNRQDTLVFPFIDGFNYRKIWFSHNTKSYLHRKIGNLVELKITKDSGWLNITQDYNFLGRKIK